MYPDQVARVKLSFSFYCYSISFIFKCVKTGFPALDYRLVLLSGSHH